MKYLPSAFNLAFTAILFAMLVIGAVVLWS